jgi:hypothetical protein
MFKTHFEKTGAYAPECKNALSVVNADSLTRMCPFTMLGDWYRKSIVYDDMGRVTGKLGMDV